MNRLDVDPSLLVRSVPELHDLARTLSAQAIELYRRLGARMADLGNESAREAFALIEAEQRRHAGALELRIPPDLHDVPAPVRRWTGLAVFDEEDLAGSRLVTPYRALAVAARNEERAFAFWTYVSAHARSPAVRAEAERLAQDELSHVHALRQARRRAYHAARRHDGGRADRLRGMSAAAFRIEAAARERRLAALHAVIAAALAAAGHPRASQLSEMAEAERASARSLDAGTAIPDQPAGALPDEPEAALGLALDALEDAAEFYLAAAERLRAEEAVADAQRLSEAAIRRLGALHR